MAEKKSAKAAARPAPTSILVFADLAAVRAVIAARAMNDTTEWTFGSYQGHYHEGAKIRGVNHGGNFWKALLSIDDYLAKNTETNYELIAEQYNFAKENIEDEYDDGANSANINADTIADKIRNQLEDDDMIWMTETS